VALEDLADEPPLTGRVQVVRARGDRRPDRGLAVALERPDGRDQHVTARHQGAHRLGPPDVGHRRVQSAEPRGQRLEALPIAGRQHRPHAALHHGVRGELAHVAGGTEQDDAP
jgi:hypothetical protein